MIGEKSPFHSYTVRKNIFLWAAKRRPSRVASLGLSLLLVLLPSLLFHLLELGLLFGCEHGTNLSAE